ncbi:hypothetical protein BABINDRAFT_159673 [Babjeviella inositovora NRRL Y-12698]|uniref:Uncharacterized protein n=1 Tax=Babjeviella inositovora NRRL Y-12698 TaxID=984486 RepID=A0A1E3R005_9ASCO|nr:uncharacterized protein BABINDRAFT_159673 [Babjeviella inositovora NRRL Y-12698]ODQ83236.1 hypothetical protein BABINDRAFT_159673 [Babjeviella inositovora NRRL Y-12698]
MQQVQVIHSSPSNTHIIPPMPSNLVGEDIIAERVLQRAEISRITRQLKSRLAKAGIKAKVENSQLFSSSPNKHNAQFSSEANFSPLKASGEFSPLKDAHFSGSAQFSPLKAPTFSSMNHLPSSATTEVEERFPSKRTLDSDATDTDTECSPMKKHTSNPTLSNIPSSPIYQQYQQQSEREHNMTTDPPQTPPSTYSSLHKSSSVTLALAQSTISHVSHLNNLSPLSKVNKPLTSSPGLSTPKTSRNRMSLLTPKGRSNDEEGADLLMFLATSPSPATYGKNSSMLGALPSLPKLQFPNSLDTKSPIALPSFNITASASGAATVSSTPNKESRPKSAFLAPATPKRSNNLLSGVNKTPITSRFAGTGITNADLLKTPTTTRATPVGFSMSDYVNFLTPSPISRAMSGRTPHQASNDLSSFHLSGGPALGASNLGAGAAGRIVNFDKLSFGGSNVEK